MIAASNGADALFSATALQTRWMETRANTALSSGIRLYQSGDYHGAIKEFRRAIGSSPQSENTLKSYDFLATALLKVGDNQGAIQAYQTALRLAPNRDDLYNKLGNVFLEEGDTDQAIASFKMALRISPSSTAYLYSLGQSYLAKGNWEEAQSQFGKIISMAPQEYGGYYGLGQAYYRAGKNEKAIEQFAKVLAAKEDFLYARVDMGYALADLGRIDEAYEQAGMLQEKDLSLAALLNQYISRVAKPEFLIAYSDSGFNPSLGPNTLVSALDASLSAPNASSEFTMKFIFSKDMDVASAENAYNWMITRATAGIEGGPYNWGMPISSSEIPVPLFPERVNYDSQSHTALVTFSLTQNESANGTLDPSHIVFRFLGKDYCGNAMNREADEYMGISKIV